MLARLGGGLHANPTDDVADLAVNIFASGVNNDEEDDNDDVDDIGCVIREKSLEIRSGDRKRERAIVRVTW